MREDTHPIIADEQRLLADTIRRLDERPYDLPADEGKIVAELLRLREELPKAKAEDRGSLMEQFNQNHSLLEAIREAREKPQVDRDSPYFAHLRLEESGRKRDVFLGKATRLDGGLRIVDWRNAPISKLYYQYRQDEEYEEPFGGRYVEGRVDARRTVTVLNGELLRIDSPDGVFLRDKQGEWDQNAQGVPKMAGGQGSAMRAHDATSGIGRRLGTDLSGSRRRQDKRLPDIAGLIDEDQFDLITRPNSGFVVIRGTAGSGKTTVALHRIAWLAYQDPKINSAQTLFLVFSPALKDYVGHVMPSLGVPNVRVRTFREWARSQRLNHFKSLPKGVTDITPAVVTRLKQHPALIRAIEEQVQRVDGPARADQAIDDWMSVLTNLDLLKEVFHELDPGAFTDQELEKATRYNHDQFEIISEWMDTKQGDKPKLDPEDDPILLRAHQLRVGPLTRQNKRPLRYKHVALDEVQDFSPLEVQVLMDCLDKNRSITLAGDTQQHVMVESGFTSWSGFFRHLGVEGAEVNTLRVSYRSSQEVVEFAIKLLGDLREDDNMPMVIRNGPPVEMFRFTDHGQAVAFLADVLKDLLEGEPLASVAMISPDRATSNLYMHGLERSEVPKLRQVTNHDFTFQPGIEIVDADQVKGLEFDYVIILEASAAKYPANNAARRLLHVAATRAVHQLWLCSVGTPSAIIREAMEEG